ncbi:MAG: hypothetical protein ABW321_10205 [Polyangiales bacterium]
MTIQLDPNTRRILQQTLQRAFPDAYIHNRDIEALALALHAGNADPGDEGPLPEQLAQLDLQANAAGLADLAKRELPDGADSDGVTELPYTAEPGVRYYWVEATHARQTAGYPAFVGKLPMVRVSLPAFQPQTFVTAIGTVEEGDHLIATVHEANDKFAKDLGYPLRRVDMITPPRQKLRFGAISVLLGYRDGSELPSCYILEAGTATGQAKVLYLGKTLDVTINQYTGYKPSPFASPSHAYTGKLTLDHDNPKLLSVTARAIVDGRSQTPYMRLDARFSEQTGTIRNIWSGLLIARAAAIVAIRQARGLDDGAHGPAVPV